MKVLEAGFVKDFQRMAFDGFEQGWHERNGGNLSYRMTKEEAESVSEEFTPGEWREIGTEVPTLAGQYFLVTGSGKYFRNVIIKPDDSFSVIEVSADGAKYRIVWGLVNGGRPTSELPTHLMNHEVKALEDPAFRVIYHAHPVNIIALSFVLPLQDEIFTRELYEMMTEVPIVACKGVGVVPWMVPGGREIGVRSSELMKQYDAIIWAHHGMFVAGRDFDETFGMMHMLEKSAEIWLKVAAAGGKRQTISAQNFKDLAVAFNVTVPEKFLYEKDEP